MSSIDKKWLPLVTRVNNILTIIGKTLDFDELGGLIAIMEREVGIRKAGYGVLMLIDSKYTRRPDLEEKFLQALKCLQELNLVAVRVNELAEKERDTCGFGIDLSKPIKEESMKHFVDMINSLSED